MRITATEIFGPAAPIIRFQDIDDAIDQADDMVGLMALLFGGEREATAVALRLEAGMAAVNRGVVSDPAAPIGGMKQSGLGRGGNEGILNGLKRRRPEGPRRLRLCCS